MTTEEKIRAYARRVNLLPEDEQALLAIVREAIAAEREAAGRLVDYWDKILGWDQPCFNGLADAIRQGEHRTEEQHQDMLEQLRQQEAEEQARQERNRLRRAEGEPR